MPRCVKGSAFRVQGAGPTLWSPDSSPQPQPQSRSSLLAPRSSAFTLVEMLVAMAITLVMMGAVVTLFANVSNSVRDRRATMEMSGQLRHARNMLQKDLQGATCPGLTWRRPEENEGYIEIIEGPYREGSASALIDGIDPPTVSNPEVDHKTSIIPASNLPFTTKIGQDKWVTDGAGLGDADDILMLTVRNEHEPFVGNMPTNVRPDNTSFANTIVKWNPQTIESPLAEVVWYAVENPGFSDNTFTDQYNGFFGEPGMRTIYRRTLLIAPWVNPYRHIDSNNGAVSDTFQINGSAPTFTAQPGLVRILPGGITPAQAIAGLIAFQERYDLSVRLEFDPLLDPANNGRWKIVANTLGDLTKRENRYEHHGYRKENSDRIFPFVVVSAGHGYTGASAAVTFVPDPEIGGPGTAAQATANTTTLTPANGSIATFSIPATNLGNPSSRYKSRPLAYVNQNSDAIATARVMLNDDGEVVRVVPGLSPLSGARRGEDVMLSDALAFDLRVFDPGAPLYPSINNTADVNYPGTILEPSDPGWQFAATKDVNAANIATKPIGSGAYVDLGYWNADFLQFFRRGVSTPSINTPGVLIDPSKYGAPTANFWGPMSPKSQLRYIKFNNPSYRVDDLLDYDYCTYDTWSFHYEHDGVNENLALETALGENSIIDKGTNGLDDVGEYLNSATGQFVKPTAAQPQILLGPDDVGERETAPPYDKPLRGVQVILRLYERDSRQIRQVSVDQHFVPE
jgi:type II secretory pathway pseudopilin PulG